MKKVNMKFLATNNWKKADILNNEAVVELNEYRETVVKHEETLIDAYSFDSLLSSALQFAEGLWISAKGLAGMMKWSVIVIISGIRWVYKGGNKNESKTEAGQKKLEVFKNEKHPKDKTN